MVDIHMQYSPLYDKNRKFKEKPRNQGKKPEDSRSCLKSVENKKTELEE
jgi:hypothetical protein